MTMGPNGLARQLTILLGESDMWHHKPLAIEIVHRAQRAGLAGASLFKGVEGFGASNVIHASRLLSMSDDLPVAVIIVDEPAAIDDFLPQISELVTEGLVYSHDVNVVHYADGRSRSKCCPAFARSLERSIPSEASGKDTSRYCLRRLPASPVRRGACHEEAS